MTGSGLARALGVAMLGLVLAGCQAHVQRGTHRTQIDSHAGQFVFEHDEVDHPSREKVARAIDKASPELARWGGLREPVHVYILPSHQALEDAVQRPDYDWLRAWAKYDQIFLQSPRTWSVLGASQSDVDELVLHELTHIVMYQQAANRTHWSRKGIPLWFREGMASFTANQGYRWPSLEDLARFLHRNPDTHPIANPEPLYRGESAIVYGAAHHAFAFLVRRYGEDEVREILRAMREEELDFRGAFEQTTGVTHDAFVEDFTRYVRLRGFRGGRLRMHRASPVEVKPKGPAVPRVQPESSPAPER
ncbi:MAG: hypothetical protein WBV82_33505 [Myxococcaceae bacterium]